MMKSGRTLQVGLQSLGIIQYFSQALRPTNAIESMKELMNCLSEVDEQSCHTLAAEGKYMTYVTV